MNRILVTGALGNVGSYVVKYLIQNKQKVVAADINMNLLESKYDKQVEKVYFDFTDKNTFVIAQKEITGIFIIRPPHLGKPQDLKPFIDSLKQNKDIKMITFLSLIGIENNPVPPHYKIEKYINQTGLPYCHIRPSFFMQNISGIHAFEIKHFNRIVVPVNNALTSFIDAEDVGEIIAKVLSEPQNHINKPYAITGPEAIDYSQVANILSTELGRNIIYANPSPSMAKKYWINIRGLDKEYSNVMGMLYMMTRLGTAKKVTSIFHDIMGKLPQTFQQFVCKNLDAWK